MLQKQHCLVGVRKPFGADVCEGPLVQGFRQVMRHFLNLPLSVQNAPVALEFHQKQLTSDELNQFDFGLSLKSDKIERAPCHMRF